jgi:prepilin-type N-terminal cleavage/methylation domain-containing protein
MVRGAAGHTFTLVELLVVIALGSILMGIAVPGMQTQKIKSATFDLVTTAMLARSEATGERPSASISSWRCRTISATAGASFTSTTTCSTGPGYGHASSSRPTYAYQVPQRSSLPDRALVGGVAVTLLVTDNDVFARCVALL